MQKRTLTLFLVICAVALCVYTCTHTKEGEEGLPDASTPEQPSETEGDVVQNESIMVYTPLRDQVIKSPLSLEGQVRGTWLFEGVAPVVLTDWDGRIIAEGYIEAQEDWMTTEFVPFVGQLTFTTPEDVGDFANTGSIIFKKDNPSGLPENDDALEYTVRFW